MDPSPSRRIAAREPLELKAITLLVDLELARLELEYEYRDTVPADLDAPSPPDVRDDPLGHFRWRLRRSPSPDDRLLLLSFLRAFRRRSAAYAFEVDATAPIMDDEERAIGHVEWWNGWADHHVAALTGARIDRVRLARRLNGLHPLDGTPEEEDRLDEDTRFALSVYRAKGSYYAVCMEPDAGRFGWGPKDRTKAKRALLRVR